MPVPNFRDPRFGDFSFTTIRWMKVIGYGIGNTSSFSATLLVSLIDSRLGVCLRILFPGW